MVLLLRPSCLVAYSGFDGFLGTRGSLMLDLVFLTMFAVVPAMACSFWRVRYGRDFRTHRRIQLTLGLFLLLAVMLFEVDVRVHGWIDRAEPSRYWRPGPWNDWVDFSLLFHLACAIPATLLWAFVVVQAIRHFANPPQPGAYSRSHRVWGRLAGIEMVLTSVTGWLFYWLPFVA
ncbi:MAG: DUF420 domain-containing protein [Planctomycetes bacterium]|nr:DUF420 domain-containing protein [Planctomycetota bacterium]